MKLPTKIPKRFHQYFWDVQAPAVDPSKEPLFVIQRLLDKGDDQSVKWILARFGRKLVKETLSKMKDFSPWTGNFWRLYLDLPRDQVACLQIPYQTMRKSHWPF